MSADPEAILMLRLSALGDIIHTAPAVSALRDAYPNTRIAWLVEAPYRDLARLAAPVDEVFTASTKRWRREPFSTRTRQEVSALFATLRSFARGQVSIDFQGLVKSAIFGAIAGAQSRYGFAFDTVREKPARALYNRAVSADRTKHVIEWNMALARSAGASRTEVRFDVSRLPDDPSGSLAPLVADSPIVFLPGAGRPEKLWGTERFAELAAQLRRVRERRILVVWGPGEEALARAICIRGDAELAPATNMRELAFVLERAALVVAGDTGPLHLAAAMATPVVALFGPTDPARNGPWGQPGSGVGSWSGSRAMDAISVSAVLAVVLEQLEARSERGLR